MARKKSANSYVMKALAQLATGRTFTFEEIRDQLAQANAPRAHRILRLMRLVEGAKLEIVRAGVNKRAIGSVRLLNIDEMAAKLQQRGVGISSHPTA